MIWQAMAAAMFSLASYQDGEPFRSGICAGIAISITCVALRGLLADVSHERPADAPSAGEEK